MCGKGMDMENLSKQKRQEMLEFLNKLKQEHPDDDSLRAIGEIETALNEKKYGLVWEKHTEKVDELLEHNIPVFSEDESKKIVADENDGYNFLLEGDNLHSLKLLEKTHKGKIDVIYIDPPYNTGNKDFIYNDSFVDKTDGYSHSKWLSFMSERLEIARELLSDEGVIFISIDDNEQAQLKLLCDEVFGESNFVVDFIWKSKSGGANDSSLVATDHEFILCFSKNYTKAIMNDDKETEVTTSYNNFDDNGFYSLERLDKQSLGYLESLDFPIISPDGIRYTVQHKDENNKKARWRWSKNTVEERYDELVFKHPYIYTKNYKKDGQKPRSLLTDERFGRTRTGSTDLKKIIGNQKLFSYPKPEKLIKFLLNISTQKNSTILDFFAGSGTTGHAVMQLNKEDGGNRKYILCTNNENKICEEVTYQRLKNIQEELPHNLKYFKTDFISKYASDEDEATISEKMLEHIKELIELEHHIEIDDEKYIILDDEDELDRVVESIQEGGKLFITSGMFLSGAHQRILKDKNVRVVEMPEYYYRSELKEVGEL